MANKIKGLGTSKGVTIEIALARTKDGREILVAGINSGANPFNKAQLAQMAAWGINVAPQAAKGMKLGPHAEENIAAFLQLIEGTGVRWSKAVVGVVKPGGSSYVCGPCHTTRAPPRTTGRGLRHHTTSAPAMTPTSSSSIQRDAQQQEGHACAAATIRSAA